MGGTPAQRDRGCIVPDFNRIGNVGPGANLSHIGHSDEWLQDAIDEPASGQPVNGISPIDAAPLYTEAYYNVHASWRLTTNAGDVLTHQGAFTRPGITVPMGEQNYGPIVTAQDYGLRNRAGAVNGNH